jgi:hypothetical protein
MSVRKRIPAYTKEQFAAMTKRAVDAHVAAVLREAEAAKARGDRSSLTYLYKSLPGDRKTKEMKEKILPFDLSVYKKKKVKARARG